MRSRAGQVLLAKGALDPGHDLAGMTEVGVGHGDAELVAAQPRGDVRGADRLPDDLGHEEDRLVAGVVAEAVVDLLQLVEVHQHQGERPPVAVDPGELAPDRGFELAPVRQAGQVVGVGLAAMLEGVVQRRRQVVGDGADEADLGLIEDPLPAARDSQQADLAVASPERHQERAAVGVQERILDLDRELDRGVGPDGLLDLVELGHVDSPHPVVDRLRDTHRVNEQERVAAPLGEPDAAGVEAHRPQRLAKPGLGHLDRVEGAVHRPRDADQRSQLLLLLLVLGNLGIEVGARQHQHQGAAEIADPLPPEGAGDGGDDRHRQLEQDVQAQALAAQPFRRHAGSQRLLDRDLVEAVAVGLDHDPGEHPGETLGVLPVVGKRQAGVFQPVQRLDGGQVGSFELSPTHTWTTAIRRSCQG